MTVIGARAVLGDGGTVVGRGIALVAGPTVLRVFLVELSHEFVTVGLGQNRCGSNAQHLAVALNDGRVRNVVVGEETVAVH